MGSGRRRRKRRGRSSVWWRQQYGGMPAWGLAAAVGLIVILGAIVVANLPSRTEARAASVYTPPAVVTPTARAEVERVAFLGDSWVGGTGAEPSGPANGYPGLTAAKLGWQWKAFTGGGTGYTLGNASGEGPFVDRVAAVIDYAPTVVVVQGSSNDFASDAATLEAAAADVYTRLKAGLPDARLVVVGAIDSPGSNPELMGMIRSSVGDAATAAGAEWIDANAAGWLDVDTDFTDAFHPNNQGHEKFATQLAAILGN